MACFLVPAAEAVIVGVSSKKVKKNEKTHVEGKIPFSRKLGWLWKLLAVGSFLSMLEHIYHGEIVPYFPFLTNLTSASKRISMLKEMATEGVAMAVVMTLIWAVALVVVHFYEKAKVRKSNEA